MEAGKTSQESLAQATTKYSAAEAELEATRQNVADLEEELDNVKVNIEQSTTDLEKANSRYSSLTEENNRLREECALKDAQLKELKEHECSSELPQEPANDFESMYAKLADLFSELPVLSGNQDEKTVTRIAVKIAPTLVSLPLEKERLLKML